MIIQHILKTKLNAD